MNNVFGLLRVRNEEQILNDTLDHLSEFCKNVFVYDDCSTDNSYSICKNHPIVKSIIKGKNWDLNRERAEFQNRQAILGEAKKYADDGDWFVYIDADERIEFNWEKLSTYAKEIIAIRMKLFDYYITPDDVYKNYKEREFIGPEYREIIILFRNSEFLRYDSPDQREVTLGRDGIILSEGFVKHYGKAISVDAWEKKCDYYAYYFPKYSQKWLNRKGKAIHTKSDFGYDLIKWNEKESKGFLLTSEIESEIDKASSLKLNILLATHHLIDYTGSEIFTYTIAEKLKNEGNNVVVYSPYLDKSAQIFNQNEFTVVNDLDSIKDYKFDIAHVHHNIIAAEVRYYFPQLPIIYLAHGVLPFLEQPPFMNLGIAKFLAVSEEVADNLKKHGINESLIQIFRNMVDYEKFNSRKEINEVPQKVLVISGRIDAIKEKIIRNVCKDLKLGLEFVGGRFGEVSQGKLIEKIEESDIVFSLGRGAIESIMMERAVIVYDYLGGDGMVTTENLTEIMKSNFSGRRFHFQFNEEELKREIKKYNKEDVRKLRLEVIKYFGAHKLTYDLIKIYRDCINKPVPYIDDNTKKLTEYFVKSIKETRNYSSEITRRKLEKNTISNNSFFNEHLIEAENNIENGNYKGAKELLNKILSNHPEDINALNDLAVVEILENNYSKAFYYLQYILKINPSNNVALENLEVLREKVNQTINQNSNSESTNDNKYEVIDCPFCGNNDYERFRYSADIVKCNHCGTVYLRTRMSISHMYELYQAYANDGSHMALPKDEISIKNSPLRRDYFLNEILNYTQAEGILLDIGCGWGAFLDNARSKGFQPKGIELTKNCVKFANDVLKIDVKNEYFEDIFFDKESISVVTMNHVLEHMPFPKLTLKKIHDILKPDGIFAGIVPNIESYCSQTLKEKWYWLDPNYHYVHYSPETLKNHLTNNGFEIIRLYTTTGDYGQDTVIKVIMENEGLDYQKSKDKLKLYEDAYMGEEIRFIVRKKYEQQN